MIRPAGEDEDARTLQHLALWPVARERVALLVSPRHRTAYGAALDALEEGWAILWGMVCAAQSTAPGSPVALVLADTAEEWRYIASECLRSVPGPFGFGAIPQLGESAEEMEVIARQLAVLEMATAHPACPAGLREPIRAGVECFGAWIARYASAVAPIALVEERCVCDGAPPPRMLTVPLRLLD